MVMMRRTKGETPNNEQKNYYQFQDGHQQGGMIAPAWLPEVHCKLLNIRSEVTCTSAGGDPTVCQS